MPTPHNFDMRLASELELGGFVGSIGFVPTDSKGGGALEIPDIKKCVFLNETWHKNQTTYKISNLDSGGDFRASYLSIILSTHIEGNSQIPRFLWIQSSPSESAGRQRTGRTKGHVMVHISRK